MDPRGTATGVILVVMAMATVALANCAGASQFNDRASILPAPSPTWLFSAISSKVTPTATRAGRSDGQAAKQPAAVTHPEVIRLGQRLFYEVGCFYCHGIQAEGDVGPQIARTELSLDLVIQQVYQPVGDMPPFSSATVSESDLAAIYAYLQSLQPIVSPPEIATDQPDGKIGEVLYLYFGCFGCHGYRGEGGVGPRLAGTDLSLEEVRLQLREQQKRMPAFGAERISDEELAHIYVFLQTAASDGETN